jgi:hypothetical protein
MSKPAGQGTRASDRLIGLKQRLPLFLQKAEIQSVIISTS